MDLSKLDAELGVKIIESLKEVLKNEKTKISFDLPNNELLEGSSIIIRGSNFKLVKRLVINEIDDINIKYKKYISNKLILKTKDMNQPQSVKYINRKTRYLFFLRPFLGKRIVKNELRSIVFRINYNNVIVDLKKIDYDRLNYYTKYVYKLQQLHKLNAVLGINQQFSVVFDDDEAAKNMYNSMYDNLGDILKPPDKD